MQTLSLRHDHPWSVTTQQAREIQTELAQFVVREDRIDRISTVAGVDVGFEQNNSITRAAIVLLSFPHLQLIEQQVARTPTRFPYVPGLLSFREVPAVLQALAALQQLPDVILCDGQGIAHPRRFGLACHLGVLTDIATIGVAKSRLIGVHDEVPVPKGSWVALSDKGETIGAVLRTRAAVKPLYISIGHKVSLARAIDCVMACVTRYRLPETTRHAHRLASGPFTSVKTSQRGQP